MFEVAVFQAGKYEEKVLIGREVYPLEWEVGHAFQRLESAGFEDEDFEFFVGLDELGDLLGESFDGDASKVQLNDSFSFLSLFFDGIFDFVDDC